MDKKRQDKLQRKAPPTGERLERIFSVEKRAIDEQARTVELAFSSEYGVDRGWGLEILDHSESAMRMGRLRDGGPVLVEHNPKDHVGSVMSADVGADRKARAVIRFGRSMRANEVFQDVTDGIKSKISVGYMVHKWEINEDTETWRATDWEPYEISFVSIPADPTVGVGRSANTIPDAEKPTGDRKMDEQDPKPAPAPAPAAAPAVDIKTIENQVRERELKRINDLEAMGKTYARFGGEEIARKCIAEGKGVAEMTALVLERVKATPPPSAEIGLTDKEAKKFSIARLIAAAIAIRTGSEKDAPAIAGFELEASEAARKQYGSKRGLVTIPYDVMVRDLTTSTASGTSKAGYTVATDLLAGSFIDVLRNKMVLPALGAQFLPGLVGNIAIPKLTTATAAYWVAENSAPTEGAPVFGQVTMSPKTVAAYVDFSRRLMLQGTPAIEGLVRDDLTNGLAVAIDEAGIGTSGTNRPTGVRGTSGIGSVAMAPMAARPPGRRSSTWCARSISTMRSPAPRRSSRIPR